MQAYWTASENEALCASLVKPFGNSDAIAGVESFWHPKKHAPTCQDFRGAADDADEAAYVRDRCRSATAVLATTGSQVHPFLRNVNRLLPVSSALE